MADGAVDALKMLLEDKPKEDDSASKDEFNKVFKSLLLIRTIKSTDDCTGNEVEEGAEVPPRPV